MMWDFSGGPANPQYGGTPTINVPSPRYASFPEPDIMRGGNSNYEGDFTDSSYPGGFSTHLTVPQIAIPQQPRSDGYIRHSHRHSRHHHHHHRSSSSSASSSPSRHHHHHHHHRSHSNPPPLRPVASQPIIIQYGHPSSHTVAHTPSPHVAISSHRPAGSPRPIFNQNFQYSKCTGRKKALCIGINYHGQANPLRGCINDARNVRDFLIKHCKYRREDIVMLTDDNPNPRSKPTRRNILDAMRWLVKSACPNDSLFFHYSGHGGQTRDLDGDELDGYDEVIYPVDFKKNGHILDDEMHRIMVSPLPAGCRLTALFDSCHSGTVLDLPYIYSSHGRLKGSHVTARALRQKETPADVISWSGCEDKQTSADTFHGGRAVGAMSHAFVSSLTQNPRQSYQQLLASIRTILYPRFSQKPQLGSSHHIDTNLQFII